MKKLLLILMFVGLAQAGWITSVQSFTDKSIDTEKRNIAAYGLNPRAYVFSVTEKDGAIQPMQCILIYTEQDLGEKNAKTTAPVISCIELKK